MKEIVTKKGRKIIIRPPTPKDVGEIFTFFNKLIEEDTYILRFGHEKVNLASEKDWLSKSLKKVKKKEVVLLGAYVEAQLVGQIEVRKGIFRKRYIGTLHLGVDRDFRGEGIGEALMNAVEDEAKEIGVKVIELQVFGENDPALSLYKKLGFTRFGVLPRSIDFRGKLLDEVYMYKRVD